MTTAQLVIVAALIFAAGFMAGAGFMFQRLTRTKK
jgi:hypothetical protein